MGLGNTLDSALSRAAHHGFGLSAPASLVQSLFGGTAARTLSVREEPPELGLDRGPDSAAQASVTGIGLTLDAPVFSSLGLGFRRSLESQQSGRHRPGGRGRTGAPGTVQPVGRARTTGALPLAYVHKHVSLLDLGHIGREGLTEPSPLLGSPGSLRLSGAAASSTVLRLPPKGDVVSRIECTRGGGFRRTGGPKRAGRG